MPNRLKYYQNLKEDSLSFTTYLSTLVEQSTGLHLSMHNILCAQNLVLSNETVRILLKQGPFNFTLTRKISTTAYLYRLYQIISGLEITNGTHSNCRGALCFCCDAICKVPIQIYIFLIYIECPLPVGKLPCLPQIQDPINVYIWVRGRNFRPL